MIMKRVWQTTVVVSAMALVCPCMAEELSLDAAISAAMEASPQLAAVRAGVEAAELGERSVRSEWMPSLAVVGSYGTYSGEVNFNRFLPGVPGAGGIDVGSLDTNVVAAAELNQVLYDGGAIGAERRGRRVERMLADEEVRRRSLDLVLEVTQAFYSVLLAEQRIEVAGRGVDRTLEGLEIVRSRRAEEEALEVELLGVESQLAADRLTVLTSEHDLELARRALNRLLGRDLDAELTLVGSLADRVPVIPEQEGVQRAAEESPEVQQAMLGLEQAEAMRERASAVARPKLDLRAGYMYIDNDLVFKGDYIGGVVSLSIPFARELYGASAAKGQAQAYIRQAEQVQRDVEAAVRLRAIQAYRQLELAYAAIEVADRSVAFHRERYRVSLSAYREQLVTFGEVLDHHSELSESELELSAARYQARVAEAEVRRVAGE
jgi:outer membrane protein TolC